MIETIDVLLATYNGERFLPNFMDSLVAQSDVKINLIVSDDGSIDNTLKIIKEYAPFFEKVSIFNGPHMGPSNNFFFLMSKVENDFVAFADQDDVWLNFHLANAISNLKKSNEKYALYFSNMVNYFSQNDLDFIWPNLNREITYHDLLFQNYCRGCSIVFNKNLNDLILSEPTNEALMHDWWLALVASTSGDLIYSDSIDLIYRIHQDNFLGINRKKFRFRFRNKEVYKPHRQLTLLLKRFEKEMKINIFKEISDIDKALSGNFILRIKLILFHWKRFRGKFSDELSFRFGLVIYPLIFARIK